MHPLLRPYREPTDLGWPPRTVTAKNCNVERRMFRRGGQPGRQWVHWTRRSWKILIKPTAKGWLVVRSFMQVENVARQRQKLKLLVAKTVLVSR